MTFISGVNALFHWSTEWQMLFNVDKCKVMHFGKHNAHYDYTLNNKSLVKVTEESTAAWSPHYVKDKEILPDCGVAH